MSTPGCVKARKLQLQKVNYEIQTSTPSRQLINVFKNKCMKNYGTIFDLNAMGLNIMVICTE